MADTVTIENEEFVSSKRASKETRYTQDYIGQLARGGAIAARRISGHWYVSLASLKAYKAKADEYKPTPPPPLGVSDDSLTFDGVEFISAARAAELTGYHQDYIGQLARGGKVPSRQLGNRWFIDRLALIRHKEQKDALLAAVQAESAGTKQKEPEATYSAIEHAPPADPFFTYTQESKEFLPITKVAAPTVPPPHALPAALPPIAPPPKTPIVRQSTSSRHPIPVNKPQRSRAPLLAGAVLTVVVVLAFGYAGLRQKALYAISAPQVRQSQEASAAFTSPVHAFINWIESISAHTVTYKRSGT